MWHTYVISNTVNMKKYIGQTILNPPSRRWKYHLASAKRKSRKNDMLITRAMRKHGVENFTIEYFPLKGEQTQERLNRAEVRAIKKYNSMHPNGYNVKEGGSNGKPSESTRKKLSIALLGVPHSEERKLANSMGHTGIPRGPYSKAHGLAVSKARKGITLGVPWSPARRVAHKSQPLSTTHRLQISKTLTGRHQSEAAKLANSMSRIGIPLSEDHKMSLRGPRGPISKAQRKARRRPRGPYLKTRMRLALATKNESQKSDA